MSVRAADLGAAAFVELVAGRRGHFRLESGHHAGLWLDLDALFAVPARVAPFVDALAAAMRPHAATMVCGPLIGGAFLAQLVARSLGIAFCYTERVLSPPPAGGLYAARYRLPRAFHAQVRGQRIAMVDDVMSAGSALRGTYAELVAHDALPVAAGALLVLGDVGSAFFAERSIAVEAVARDEFELWAPADCPRCREGVPLEDATAAV